MSGNHDASKEIQLPAGRQGVDGSGAGRRPSGVYRRNSRPFGMMAERALISPQGSVELPEDVDSVTAAAVPIPGISAWMSLEYGAGIKARPVRCWCWAPPA